MNRTPVTARELARRLAITPDTFYRTRARLHADDGLPQPITGRRPLRWDPASIDAWFGRHHPHAPRREAANDQAPPQLPATNNEWAARLAQEYGTV